MKKKTLKQTPESVTSALYEDSYVRIDRLIPKSDKGELLKNYSIRVMGPKNEFVLTRNNDQEVFYEDDFVPFLLTSLKYTTFQTINLATLKLREYLSNVN